MGGFGHSFSLLLAVRERLTNRKFDSVLDGKLRPTVCAWVQVSTPLYYRTRNRNKDAKKDSSFPIMRFCVCVCFTGEREDVDSRTDPIRIEANSIRGQRRALWVEIALPLLRENIEKPPHRLIKTINVDKCQ